VILGAVEGGAGGGGVGGCRMAGSGGFVGLALAWQEGEERRGEENVPRKNGSSGDGVK